MPSPLIVGPHPGFQTRALRSSAEIIFLGARAGVGKTRLLNLFVARLFAERRAATCITFRRKGTDLGPDFGIIKDARKIFMPMGARYRQTPRHTFRWDFGNGEELSQTFAPLPDPLSAEDYKGPEFGLIAFDELTDFLERHFEYMLSRLRVNRDAGFPEQMLATLNPVPGGWIRSLLDYFIGEDGYTIKDREGVIRWMVRAPDDWETTWITGSRADLERDWPDLAPDAQSFTLIPGRQEDNPTQNWTAYNKKLAAQREAVRASLMWGNWDHADDDEGRIWDMPPTCPFRDDDPDFVAFVNSGNPLNLYGAWDYGRSTKGLCWMVGVLQPGSPTTLWVIGCRVWTNINAEQAAQRRMSFLEGITNELGLNVGHIMDFGDPAGASVDSDLGWRDSLKAHHVPLVDLRSFYTEEKRDIYWNTVEGIAMRIDLVQSWLDAGRVRVRAGAAAKPLLESLRKWRFDIMEGLKRIETNKQYLEPMKNEHSHPGDTFGYLHAGVSAVLQRQNREVDLRPSSQLVRHSQALRAVSVGSRGRNRRGK